MNNFKNLILCSLVFSTFICCKSIVKSLNGEKRMKQETHQSIVDFAKEQNLLIDFERNFYLKNRKNNEVLASFRSYNSQEKVSFPDVYIFDSNWFLVEDENVACYNQKIVNDEYDYYDDFLNSPQLTLNTSKNLSDLDGELFNKSGESIFPFQKKSTDTFYVIVLWSKYKGKMWANETNFIIQQLQDSTVDFDIYFLNMDLINFEKPY